MGLLSRAAIIGHVDVKTQDVDVPEWGGAVRVRQMTVAERNEFVARSTATESRGVAAWLVASLCVDDAGQPLFSTEDIPELEKKYYRTVDKIAAAILQVNELGTKEVDEAAKN